MRKVVGIHSAREALKARSKKEIKRFYLKPAWEKNIDLVRLSKLAEEKHIQPEILSLKKMNQIHEYHQGVCVEVEDHLVFSEKDLKEKSVVLILDGLEDPKNFGAIIRTSWLMGVDGIFISSNRSVSLTPSVIKVASGGVEYVPIEIRQDLYSCVEYLKKADFWVYALDSFGKESFWQEKFPNRTAFILGSEESGVRKSLLKVSDKKISIPQKTQEASYNVSVVAGMALSEYSRQLRIFE
ncbi:MAG: TrmH family RNA methyltransferase [Bdellovibrionales bacterium]